MNKTRDDARPTTGGIAVPWEMPGQADAVSDVHIGYNKPLLLSPEWLQDYFGAGPNWSDWAALPSAGLTESFGTTSLPGTMNRYQDSLSLEHAVQQLTQAMAGFHAPGAGLTEPASHTIGF